MSENSVAIKVERRNGFFSNLGSEQALRQLPRFLSQAGLTTAVDEKQFAQYVVEPHGKMTEFFKRSAAALAEFLKEYDIRVRNTETTVIDIGVNKLHCPHITGAKAKLSLVRELKENEDYRLEVLGIGGGDEFTISYKISESIETEGACLEMVHSLAATVELCEMKTPDGRLQTFPRLKGLDHANQGTKFATISGADDDCQKIDSITATSRQPIDLLEPVKATGTRSFEIAGGVKSRGDAKLSLKEFGIELGATYVVETTSATSLEYTLPSGYFYVAVGSPHRDTILWEVRTSKP